MQFVLAASRMRVTFDRGVVVGKIGQKRQWTYEKIA